MRRRIFVASSLAAVTGCARFSNALNDNPTIHGALLGVEPLNHLAIGTRGLAREYNDADVDVDFRTNGFDTPGYAAYQSLAKSGFGDYKLLVDGLVDAPQTLPLAQLRALATQTQITRHDCVEGWSAIGKWTGVQLATVLALARPKDTARYVVFHCYDRSPDNDQYYESLDMHQAAHPQALLALDLNGKPLDADHGAPVRLRVPTQLGYKSAKWVNRIELAADFKHIFGGKGGYWEDQGYEWYAGI